MNSKAADPAAFLKEMQGRWRTVYSEIDGQMGPEEKDHFLIYKGNMFTVEKEGKVAHEGRFSFNTSYRPIHLVYIYSKSFPIYLGGPRAGIVQLERDTIKCCFAAVGHLAPRDFNTFPGSESVLTIHERILESGRPHKLLASGGETAIGW